MVPNWFLGGIFLNVMTKVYLETVDKLKNLGPLMHQMELEKIWQKIDHFLDQEPKQGIYHVYRKL